MLDLSKYSPEERRLADLGNLAATDRTVEDALELGLELTDKDFQEMVDLGRMVQKEFPEVSHL